MTCCWFNYEQSVFSVILAIKTQSFFILTPCLIIASYVAPQTNAYFDDAFFATTYSDHLPFFLYLPCLVFMTFDYY